MKITMRVYATLHRYLPELSPGQRATFELPQGATIGDALDHVGIPRTETKLCFVNGRRCEPDYGLRDGDELGLFPPIGGGSEATAIRLEVWLYGPLAAYGGSENRGSYARLELEVPAGTTVGVLLKRLGVPAAERGISFVNGQLTAMPGLAADLERELRDGDRVAFFHRRTMWPFQYRFGASTSDALREAMQHSQGGAVSHFPVSDD